MGKTRYCRSVAPPDQFMEVNCEKCPEPYLKGLDPTKITAILFDEAKPAMVIKCKKLFMAPNCWLTMGTSNTNCNSYTVWVHRCKMMICSNTWEEDLAKLSSEDQAWITNNSFFYRATEKLYVE
jgi:hypothetical protein